MRGFSNLSRSATIKSDYRYHISAGPFKCLAHFGIQDHPKSILVPKSLQPQRLPTKPYQKPIIPPTIFTGFPSYGQVMKHGQHGHGDGGLQQLDELHLEDQDGRGGASHGQGDAQRWQGPVVAQGDTGQA